MAARPMVANNTKLGHLATIERYSSILCINYNGGQIRNGGFPNGGQTGGGFPNGGQIT
jgi:hypothetical protein